MCGEKLRQRRDTALIRVLFDTGGRLSETAGLDVDDVDLRRDVLLVNGKGGKQCAIPFGEKTGQALSPREANTRYVSLFPKWVGQTQPRLDGETLRLSTATPIRSGGVLVHSHLDTSSPGSAR